MTERQQSSSDKCFQFAAIENDIKEWLSSIANRLKFCIIKEDILEIIPGWIISDVEGTYRARYLRTLHQWKHVPSHWGRVGVPFAFINSKGHQQILNKSKYIWNTKFNSLSELFTCQNLNKNQISITFQCYSLLRRSSFLHPMNLEC